MSYICTESEGNLYVSKTIVDDELSSIELCVAHHPQGKMYKLEAMVDSKREIPHQLKTMRSQPGLGPNYRFSTQMRLKVDELNHGGKKISKTGSSLPGNLMTHITGNIADREKKKIRWKKQREEKDYSREKNKKQKQTFLSVQELCSL